GRHRGARGVGHGSERRARPGCDGFGAKKCPRQAGAFVGGMMLCAILGSNQRGREAFDREVTVRSRTGEMPPMIEYGARYWDRTSTVEKHSTARSPFEPARARCLR